MFSVALQFGCTMMPPTEKIHEIIARTATFVSQHGGQSEIILRVKQGDNPTFGFLMPDHNLHAYYRFLVDHQEVLQSESDSKSQCVDANAEHKAVGAEGALSLLGSIYGSGEDEDSVMEDAQECGNAAAGKMNADISITSHVAEKAEFRTYAASKNEVHAKYPLHSKDKPSSVKKNPSISAPNIGRMNSVKKEAVSGSSSAASENLEKSFTLEPPPDLKVLVEKIVDFITKNGKQFEASLREQDAKQGRFPFLVSSNKYHPYYLKVLKKAEESKGGASYSANLVVPDKKTSSCKEDEGNSALYSDMPYELDRKEKFKMIIGKSKKDLQDNESKATQQEHGINIDAEAAAAILQAATRGFKNACAGTVSSSSLNCIQPLGNDAKQGSDLDKKVLVSDTEPMAKAGISGAASQPDSDPPLTKEQKVKAERLKRAKMFVAMLKSGTVPSKDELSRALSVEPSELRVSVSPGKVNQESGEGSRSALVDCSISEKIINAEVKSLREEYNEKRSKRKYRSRSETHEDSDQEELEGNHSEYVTLQDEEEKSRKHSRKKHRSRQDREHDKDYKKEASRKQSRKRLNSCSSSPEDDEGKSADSSLHRHSRKVREKSHRRSSKRHRSRGFSHEDDDGESSESSPHKHSSNRHSSHRHKREEDDEKAAKHSRRKHRSHRSSHSRKEERKKSKAHSSVDEGSEYGHYGKHSEGEKRSVLGRDELEEGEISPKVSDQSKSVAGHVSREASADVASTNGRASSQPSETIHISDDLRAKVRAMLMTSM